MLTSLILILVPNFQLSVSSSKLEPDNDFGDDEAGAIGGTIEAINIYCEDKTTVARTVTLFELFLQMDAAFENEDGSDLTIGNLSEIHVGVELLCKFGTFLVTSKNSKGKYFKQSACYKYLSVLVSTILRKKFPNCILFKCGKPVPDWYTKLRKRVGRKSALQSMDIGDAIVDKPYGIGPNMLMKVNGELYRSGLINDIRAM